MNNYPTWWNTTITIYNKFEDPQTNVITWHKHTIENCFWQYAREKVFIGNTTLETDSTKCRIPIQENFLEKYEWANMPNDTRYNYFTLSEGDIVVRGTVNEDIDEYTNGKRSSDFIAKHKKLSGCIMIKYIDINTTGGRANEHYLIKGV